MFSFKLLSIHLALTRLCVTTLLAFVASACQVNPVASEDDTPVSGGSVYELLVLQRDLDRTFNILFIPDESYGDLSVLSARQAFLDDLGDLIENSYWQNQGYYFNFPHFNYFYSTDAGSVTERPDDSNGNFQCPSVDWPASINSDGAFADVTLLIHTNNLRDCAWPGSGRATAEPDSFRTVAHETAHATFGLNDEYCCDSNYSVQVPVLYSSQNACQSDAANNAWRSCLSFTSSRNGSVWWRSEGDITTNALMRNGGFAVHEFGPADWVVMDAAYQSLPGVGGPSGTGDPTVFAPATWDRPPPP